MRRFISLGSHWYLNETEGWYVRTPKIEGPRPLGPWKEPEPGDALFDLERHPMLDWAIVPKWPYVADAILAIEGVDVGHDRQVVDRILSRARRYYPDAFPLLVILVSDDGNMVSAPGAVEG